MIEIILSQQYTGHFPPLNFSRLWIEGRQWRERCQRQDFHNLLHLCTNSLLFIHLSKELIKNKIADITFPSDDARYSYSSLLHYGTKVSLLGRWAKNTKQNSHWSVPDSKEILSRFKLWKWGEKWQLQGYLLEEGTKPEPRLVDEMSWYQDCCYHRKQKFHKSLTIP